MIEVFRNTTEYISHAVYVSGTPTDVDSEMIDVVIVNPATGERWVIAEVESLELGRYRALLPHAATQYDATLKSYWSYTVGGEPVVAEEDIEVVTPYVSMEEITSLYPQLQSKNYEELRHMERKVRLMINKITGQDFGSRRKVVAGELNSSGTLALADKAYHVHYFTVNGMAHNLNELRLLNDGWLVQVTFPGGYYHMKSDTHLVRREAKMSVVLHGNFGWPTVPNEINMAAKLLIGDYFCNDAIYRARGVQAIRAADWRLDFHDSAFAGTGNLEVDLLLGKFSSFNMVII